MKNSYFDELKLIKSIVKKSYNTFKNESKKYEEKYEFDIVTIIDKKIETFLINKIKQKFPSDTFYSEEDDTQRSINSRTWTIDPIDGTFNMSRGSHLFGIQLSLIENNEIVFAYIYLPELNEEYYAIKGSGAYKNDKEIHANEIIDIKKSIVGFGDFSHHKGIPNDVQLDLYKALIKQVAKIRMLGSAAIDFTNVASGKFDAYISCTSNLWDLCPGILIAKEAGANVTNFDNKPYKFGDIGVIATANDEIQKIIANAIKSMKK